MDMGKSICLEFVGEAIGLPMTLDCLRLIWLMHLICYSIGYRHASEAALSILVFYWLGGFINCLPIANAFDVLGIRKYVGWPQATLSRLVGHTAAAHTYTHISI